VHESEVGTFSPSAEVGKSALLRKRTKTPRCLRRSVISCQGDLRALEQSPALPVRLAPELASRSFANPSTPQSGSVRRGRTAWVDCYQTSPRIRSDARRRQLRVSLARPCCAVLRPHHGDFGHDHRLRIGRHKPAAFESVKRVPDQFRRSLTSRTFRQNYPSLPSSGR
jgi:hypothetical protein